MKKRIISSLLLIIPLAIVSSRCAPPFEKNQLQFGIQAAKNDLWDEAVFRWKKAVQIDPNSAAVHNNLAVAYEKKGLWEEAKKEYELALRIKPEDQYIKSNFDKFKKLYEEQKKDEDKKK